MQIYHAPGMISTSNLQKEEELGRIWAEYNEHRGFESPVRSILVQWVFKSSYTTSAITLLYADRFWLHLDSSLNTQGISAHVCVRIYSLQITNTNLF